MPVHEKILRLDIEKPGIATWLSDYSFLFSVMFFHVDSCESYATLDTPRGEKSGDESFFYLHQNAFNLIIFVQMIKLNLTNDIIADIL